MGEVVNFPTAFEDNQEFVADCCRFAEGILEEKAVRKKYKLADVPGKLLPATTCSWRPSN